MYSTGRVDNVSGAKIVVVIFCDSGRGARLRGVEGRVAASTKVRSPT